MENLNKKANIVLVACILFNLSIGVLYAWSVLTSHLTAPLEEGGFGWSVSQAGLPYSIAIVTFATAMLIGGRIQDKIGPRKVVTAGGILMGLGLIAAGFVGNSVIGIVLSFGVLASTGMGFGYACVTAPALKWFHPGKKGLVSGLIVGGFGLSAVGIAPLASALLDNFGIERTFIILGMFNLIVTTAIAQLITNPPPDYTPPAPDKIKATTKAAPSVNFEWTQMLKTGRFYMMFVIFVLTSSVGLMVIGNLTRIARSQANISDAAILAGLVAFLALMNTAGRVFGGIMSDKIGRINSLFVILGLQLINMAAFAFYQNLPALILGLIIVGFCFGALLSVMPALCADLYGLKNFGINYGILFLAWGLSGVITPVIANYFYDATGSFTNAYIICAIMMAVMVCVNFVLKRDVAKG
ncbi:MAG: OFA family MFS transporter [Defluviitaleaceae bacterium]|nr:OFA family MFS transporter [Defluviitaleaceae bacterium]